MPFPTSPTNGQTVTVNGINYQYSTVTTAWKRVGVVGITTASQVQTQAQTTNSNHYLTFVDTNNSSAKEETIYTTSSFVVNPSSGNVTITGSITAGGVRSSTTSTAPTNPTVGDVWYNTSNDTLYRFTNDGSSTVWLDITGPVSPAAGATGPSVPVGKTFAIAMTFGG